ncbi:MAG TPA: hypothetical protein VF032_01660 [Thermoleophilaceae bacterium]
MHYHRVHLSGPEAAVEAVGADLVARGGSLLEHGRLAFLTLADGSGEVWEELSQVHRGAVLGVEGFELFDDEFVQTIVASGVATEMARRSVVPEACHSFYDEGDPLDESLVRTAAELVNGGRLRHELGPVSRGLDVSLEIGAALGRLCAPPASEGASARAVDGVIELGARALWVSSLKQWSHPAERDFEHALGLTRSVVQVCRSEFFDQPGSADWSEWLQVLIGATSDVLDAATHWWPDMGADARAVGSEHFGTPQEQLEGAAQALLTTCLETLALFACVSESQ